MRRKRRREPPPNFYCIRKIIAETEREVGLNTERRVIEAYSPHLANYFPPWIYGVRAASNDEDHSGIDVVFETDVGVIALQVKNSWLGALKFLRAQMERELDAGIVTAVIRVSDESKRIREIVTPILSAERRRRTSDNPKLFVPPKAKCQL